ncbi:Voltage-gated ion channel, partial [Globisporangium splendens]
MTLWRRRISGSGTSFRETFRNRKRSGSTEFLFSEIQNAFDPSSSFIATWQQLVLGCILYELLLIPYMATFHPYDLTSSVSHDLLGMYVCELVFCADIYVQLNTCYYEDGNVLRDTRKSRIKYLKSIGFVLDVLALPPLSLLPVRMHLSAVFLEFHKLSRLRRLPQLISNLDNLYARYFEPLKLVKVLGTTIAVSHLIACGRFTFGCDSHHNDHWLPQVHEHEQSDRSKYLMSLFWAFGLLTGLFEGELPHTNAEFAFTIFVALCGFSLFTYLCATFFMLSKCESGDSETSEARVNQFKHILAFHRVPGKLQEQAVEYLKRYYTQAEANDREAARLLCPSISTDTQVELLKDTVAQIPVFEGCDSHFINAVTSLLELISCPAHFVLFQTGDHGDAMYVVSSGVLYTVVNGVKVRELRKGSFFGEVAYTVSTLAFSCREVVGRVPSIRAADLTNSEQMLQQAQTSEEDKISEIASAGAIQVQKKKKKSSLLQVVGLKTEQRVWRSKKSLTQVKPALAPPSSSTGSATSLRRSQPEHQIVLIESMLSQSKLAEAPNTEIPSTANVDAIQWVDIYLSLNLSYSLNSEKIFDPVRSAERYFKSWSFFTDICCVWPYAMFKPSLSNTAAIRIPRLLRVWRLKGHFSEVENYMLINSRKRLILFGLVLLMLYHVVACLHFSITHWEGFSHKVDAWIPSDDIYMRQMNESYFEDVHGLVYPANSAKVQRTRAMQYFRSLYYATNVLAALGRTMEPDSERQHIAALLFMLSGFLITAIVVDNVQKRFTASAFEQKEFFATRSRIQLFLKRQNSPLSIHQRVNSFLDFWWSSHRGAIIHELLEELPAAIKRDIVRSICTPAIESFDLLRVEDPCRVSTSNMIPVDVRSERESIFLNNLRFILFGQGEIIYRLGDYAGGLYFVLEGRVSVMPDGGMPHSVPLGGFFGTAALDLHEDMGKEAETLAIGYTEHVTAISGCIVVHASREHLLAMKKVFPSLSVSLRALERKIRSTKVARTSLLEQVLTGPPESSPTLRRAMLGSKASEPLTVVSKGMGLGGNQTCFDPDSKFVSMWEMWIFFAMTAQCVLVIYHTCFGVYLADNSSVFVVADTVTILLESCFLIDMYLQFRLGYYEYGNKVMDIQLVKTHYLHTSHFYMDLVALIPLFTLNWLSSAVQDRAELLNWNKLLRILKAPTLFKSLESKCYMHFGRVPEQLGDFGILPLDGCSGARRIFRRHYVVWHWTHDCGQFATPRAAELARIAFKGRRDPCRHAGNALDHLRESDRRVGELERVGAALICEPSHFVQQTAMQTRGCDGLIN